MPDLITQLQYNDPLTIIARKGTVEDPYIDRADSLPVINGIITLLELPSLQDRVSIAGMIEIDQEIFEQRKIIESHEFLVNYASGTVQVHPSLEGRTLLCRFKGRGLIMYPASRIYALVRRHPDVVVTLQDYISEIEQKLAENQSLIGKVEQLITETRLLIDESRKSTDNANRAADEADRARDQAMDAFQTTRLVFKPTVADMKELHTTYPYPSVGWTVQTYSDGVRYRYDGIQWVPIDIFGANIQPVNEFRDGLMSVAEHLKLKSFPYELKERVVIFCLPSYIFQGIQEVIVPFPFDGEITSVHAICKVHGDTETEISIEKSRNIVDWSNILSNNLHFRALSNFDDKAVSFTSNKVTKGDMFRVNVLKQGVNIQGITIELKIKI
ncbi:hypothetical protein M2277_002650 [Paenibacillus sp. LBL]|uniref:hypothetical protein n=1 Tax=Paenibacillus sp. LBL TaxID=2940563 RepID=UPI00247361C7|nr:hypothetical protein [Paenibacillus sp. LBL]MDH6671988.1 hypothetical protein [Paenibacillus sp. LBL]